MLGLTEEQFSEFFVTYGVALFILFMLFIIAELAYKSKAGKRGTFILFAVLAFGMFGFAVKTIIQKFLGI